MMSRGQDGRPTTDQVMEGRFEDEERRDAMVPRAPEHMTARVTAQQPLQGPPAPAQAAMTSAETDVLFRELALAQLEFGEVKKTRTAKVVNRNGEFKYEYQYANLSDVTAAVMPALKAHGLVAIQVPRVNRIVVRIVHGPSGQWVEGALPFVAPGQGPEGIQAMGSAITYMRRYLLCMMLGVVAVDDDDDGAVTTANNARRPTMGTRGRSEQHREPGED